jgi:hypothetical protein
MFFGFCEVAIVQHPSWRQFLLTKYERILACKSMDAGRTLALTPEDAGDRKSCGGVGVLAATGKNLWLVGYQHTADAASAKRTCAHPATPPESKVSKSHTHCRLIPWLWLACQPASWMLVDQQATKT